MYEIIERDTIKLPGITSLFINIPYNNELLKKLKTISRTKYYHKDSKEWEFPLINFKEIFFLLKEHGNVKVSLKDINIDYDISIPEDYDFIYEPMPHQYEGIMRGLNDKGWILGDDPGLGKTFQIIHIAGILKKLGLIKQALIICGTASIKWNWIKDIEKHSNEKGIVLGTRYRKNGKRINGTIQDRIDDLSNTEPLFLVTNIETLRDDRFIEAVKKNTNINLCAIDEAHKANNHKSSKQGRNLQKLDHFEYKIPVTGTLIINNPLDPYAMLKWSGNEKSNYSTFTNFYTKWLGRNYFGIPEFEYRNLNVLQDQLSRVMLKRNKDILGLPPKIYSEEIVEMGEDQQKLYEDIRSGIIDNFEFNFEELSAQAIITRLRQITSFPGNITDKKIPSAKVDRAVEWVEWITAQKDKAIIFTNFRATAFELEERLKKFNPVLMLGGISDEEAENNKDKFMTDDTCSVIIGTPDKLGVSHTLTAARYVFWIDEPWTKAEMEQGSDRAHRIGTKDTVFVISFITKDTIDERVHDIIEQKAMYSDVLIDGKEVPNSPKGKDMLKYLLNY